MPEETSTLALAIDSTRARDGAGRFVAATKTATTGAKELDRAVDGVDKRMAGMGSTMQTVRRAVMGLAASYGGLRGVTATVRVLQEFETTMLTVQGVTGATDQTLKGLTKTARELGATTRFSASEAADGLLFLGRAGFTAQESIEALPATLNLAAAGAIGLGEAADIASNVLSQFNLQADETVRVVDVLLMTSNSANTNVQQLAQAFRMAGPVAGALGITIEETAGAIGTLGNSGIQASMAGTNMRGVMLALIGPTSAAKKAVSDLGLSLDDVNPIRNGLIGAFEALADANLTAAAANEIFGRRNAAAALILSANVDVVRELTAANNEANGEAERMAGLMTSGLFGAMRSFVSVVQELVLQIGDAGLTGTLNSVFRAMTDGLRILAGMEDKIEGNVKVANALVFAIRALTVALVTLITVKVASFFFGAAAAAGSFAGAIAAVTAAIAANPIGAFAIALGLVGAVFLDMLDNLREGAKAMEDFSLSTELTYLSLNDLTGSIKDFGTASVIFERGLQLGDTNMQLDAMNRQLEAMKQLSLDLRKGVLADEVVRVDPSDLLGRISIGGDKAKLRDAFIDVLRDKMVSGGSIDRVIEKAVNEGYFQDLLDIEAGEVRRSIHGKVLFKGRAERLGAEMAARRLPASDPKLLDTELFFGDKPLPVDQVTAIELVEAAIRSVTESMSELKDEGESLTASQEKAIERLNSMALTLAFEKRMLNENSVEQARQEALRRANKIVIDEQLEGMEGVIAKIGEEAAAIEARRLEIREENKEKREAERLDKVRERQAASLEAMVDSLTFEREQLSRSNVERDVELALRRASAASMDLEKEKRDELLDVVEREARVLAELNETRREEATLLKTTVTDADRATESFKRMNEVLDEQIALIGLEGFEREKAIQLRRLEQLTTIEGTKFTEEEIQAYKDKLGLLQRMQEEQERVQEVESLFKSLGDTVADSFERAVFEGGKLMDMLEDLARSLSRQVFNTFFTKQLSSIITAGISGPTPIPSAKGNVFGSNGHTRAFAGGGFLVNSAQNINMGGFGRALVGEGVSPELVVDNKVFPLERDSNGNLGIGAVGAGGGTNVNVNMTVVTPDADSFRRSRSQIARDLQTAANGAIGRT